MPNTSLPKPKISKAILPQTQRQSNEKPLYRFYLGIDPGASGGLTCIGTKDNRVVTIDSISMPETIRDIWDWLGLGYDPFNTFAVIEKVGGYIKSASGDISAGGAQRQSGHTMFKFGMSYGMLLMALVASKIPYEEIPPQKWQKGLGVTPRGKGVESQADFKRRLKHKAQGLYPNEKVTLKTADALLIAHYCKLSQEGKLYAKG